MDQIDAILRLKECFKELEEIDESQVYGNINAAKKKISEKILGITEVLDLSDCKPKTTIDICEICKEPIRGVGVGTGTGHAHPDCYYKPNVPKPRGPLKLHKIHNHPYWEQSLDLVLNHVIIDREIFDQLLEKWNQVEKCL